jgi:hypothetical protein
MGKETEVRTRLTLDGAGAEAFLARIRQGFSDVDDTREETQEGFGDLAKQTIAMAAAVNFMPAVHSVIDLGKSFFEAGVAAQEADQAVAGLISSVQGLPWEQARAQAVGFGDDLDEIALRTMQDMDDVAGAFTAITEVTGATAEGLAAATRQTEQMSIVANVLHKDATGLAREFAFMGEGVLKTKGQLFQLLQPTGIFGDNTKKAAEHWAKMTDESRTQALAFGLGKVSEQLRQAEPTIGDYLTTIDNLYNMTIEKVGEPLAKSLAPALEHVIAKMKIAVPQIEKFAEEMANDVGKWVMEAVDTIEEGFKYLKDHQQEIRDAVVEAYREAKAVVQWILDHKEEIAIAFGAKAIAPAVGQVGKLGGALLNASATGVPGLGLAGTGGGIAAGAATMGAFAAAVIAFAAAVDQWQSLMSETGGGKSEAEQDQAAREARLKQMIAAPDVQVSDTGSIKRFEELRKAYVDTALELGQNARAAGELADKAWNAHKAMRDIVGPVEEAAKMLDMFAEARSQGRIPDEQSLAQVDSLVQQTAASFTKALGTQATGAQQYIANLLLSSEGLRNAFLAGADLTGEGFDALAALVQDKSGEFAEQLRARSAEARGGAATQAAPKIVMTGGQTFKIQQDFRNQDPDRVAMVFQRDLARSVTNLTQARTLTTPFGT